MKSTNSMRMALPAVRWNDALPVGNGTLGALVYGNVVRDTMVLNHENLWLPVYPDRPMPHMHQHLEKVRELCRAGKFLDAAKFWYAELKKTGSCDEWVNSYQPAAQIDIHHTCDIPFLNYAQSLDFCSGLARTSWQEGENILFRETFVSRVDQVVVTRLKSDNGLSDEVTLSPRKAELEARGLDGRGNIGQTYIDYDKTAAGELTVLTGKYKNSDRRFHVLMRVVRQEKEILIISTVLAPEQDSLLVAEKSRILSLNSDFDALFALHSPVHEELYNRVSFNLAGSDSITGESNEALLLKAYSGDVPAGLYERMFNYSRYLFISSVGKLPPNLQGVWNGSWNPGWSCDYTMDENIQMNYWQALQGNFPESCHAFFNFFESQFDDWRENARNLFNCKGLHAPIKSTTHGKNFHFLGIEWAWHFWHSTAGWLAQVWYDYYLFTGDNDFLKERVIPLNFEIAEFYEDFLIEDDNGVLQFIPSISPENTPSNGNSMVAVNATIEIAIAKEVLRNLISACKVCEIHTDKIAGWQKIIDRLPEYKTNEDGAIKEWQHPDLLDNYDHRHQSHIYPVFPAFETTKKVKPELLEACRVAVEKRLIVGIEHQTSWSLGHMACIFARLGQGERALECLENIIRVLCGPNLFTYHNDYQASGISCVARGTRGDASVFQIDANLCFSAAVMEMLLFSRPDYLELLPALPKSWQQGTISGIRARGGITVDIKWQDGKLIKAVLISDMDKTHRIVYGDKDEIIDLKAGKAKVI